MRVLVTGATGNLGNVLVPRLLAAGHAVTGVARRVPEASHRGGADWVELDLSTAHMQQRLREALEGVDAVVHTAWGFQPTRDTAYLRRLDVGGTRAVLAAAAAAGVPHLVHVSSVGAYSPGRDAGEVEEDWPTGGAADLPYARHKCAAERLLDGHEAEPGKLPVVARLRPSIYARRTVGGALGRYVLPSLTPSSVLPALPVLPLDRGFRLQVLHSGDVADAVVRVLERRATGAFNLAAGPVLTQRDIAEVLGRPAVHLPWAVLRRAAGLAWALRLQPVDPGWLDMGWQVPLMSTRRAREELGWAPQHDARDVLREAWEGIVEGAGEPTPVLRPRTWPEQLRNLLARGPVSRRRLP